MSSPANRGLDPFSAYPATAGVDRSQALSMPPGPLLRTAFRIAGAWKLSRQQTMELLGLDSSTLYQNWKRDPDKARLKLHMIERLSHTFAIYENLHALFEPSFADAWVSRPDPAPIFHGGAPIELMTGFTTDLALVRRWLDGERHR